MQDDSLRAEHFCTSLQKNMAGAKSTRKDEIDVLRTAFWFSEIRARLNASTAYEIERRLEPKAFSKRKNGEIHRNKWPKYQVGKHVPTNSLVTQVDAILPGSKRVLNHILWEILQAKHPIKEHVDDWIRKLDPEIQECVFKSEPHGMCRNQHRISSSRRQLISLEKRTGIEALACLTILLRESCEQGEKPHSIEIGKSIYRMLLVLCNTSPFVDFTQVLFDVYRRKVFSLLRYGEVEFMPREFDHINAVKLLSIMTLKVIAGSVIDPDEHELIRIMYKILDGRHGFKAKFALDLPSRVNLTVAMQA